MTDEHLTDEVLSAVLDGEATPAEARHAAECETCASRLGVLQRAASVIGSRVPPVDPAAREAAIAAALGARVVPLRSRSLPMGWLAAAAAAVVAIALAVPIVRDSDGRRDETASKGVEDLANQSAGSLEAPAPVVDLGDLGGVDGDSLAERVRSALAPAPAAATGESGSGGATGGDGAGSTTSRMALDADAPCVAHFREGSSDFGVLRGTGTARIGDRQAVVLAFASAGRVRVVAVDPAACDEVLLSVSYTE